MKKLLLSLATVALASSAMLADTVTWDFNQEDAYGLTTFSSGSSYETTVKSLTQDDVTIAFTGNYRLWDYSSQGRYELRCMTSSTLTVSVPEGATINSITFTGTNTSKLVADENAVTTDSDTGVTTYNGTDIKYTASSRADVVTLTVDYTPATLPDGKEAAGISWNSSSQVYTTASGLLMLSTAFNNPNNLDVTFTSSDESVVTVTPLAGVYLQLRFVNYGTATIIATTEETDEFAAGKAVFTVTYMASATTAAQMYAKAPNKGDVVRVNCYLNVVYKNGSYLYVADDYGNSTLIYGSNNYEVGQVIPSGWDATNATYNGLLEWKGTLPAAAGWDVEVNYNAVETVSTDDINKVLLLKGVTFDEATPLYEYGSEDNSTKSTFTGTLLDGSQLTFYTNFDIDSVEAGQYDVLVAPAYYYYGQNDVDYTTGGTLQVYPIEFSEYVPDPEFPTAYEVTSEDATVLSSVLAYDEDFEEYTLNVEVETTGDEFELTFPTPEGYNEVYYLWFGPDDDGGYWDDDNDVWVVAASPKKVVNWVTPTQVENQYDDFLTQSTTLYLETYAGEGYGKLFFGRDGKLDNRAITLVITVNQVKPTVVLPEEMPTDFVVTIHEGYSDKTLVESKFEYVNGYGYVLDINFTTAYEHIEFTIEHAEGWNKMHTNWDAFVDNNQFDIEDGNDDDDSGIELYNAPRRAVTWIDDDTKAAFIEYLTGNGFNEGNTFAIDVDKDFGYSISGDDLVAYIGVDDNVSYDEIHINVTANYDDSTVGVGYVEAANAEAEYYTLQGVKVANPEKGVYVRVANGKAEKVVVK